MTRKDYVLIAEAINEFREEYGGTTAAEAIACVMARRLTQENERFDYSRFMEACGVAYR